MPPGVKGGVPGAGQHTRGIDEGMMKKKGKGSLQGVEIAKKEHGKIGEKRSGGGGGFPNPSHEGRKIVLKINVKT